MHDLNTINRLNAEAFADSIHGHRAAGRFVLASYEGLHLVAIETYGNAADAQAAFAAATEQQHGGARVSLFFPLQGTYARAQSTPVRDQSEDRKQPYTLEQLAALGNSSVAQPADTTLGDYINRKTI